LAFADRNRVGEHVEPAHALNDAGAAARITRETGVGFRIDVARVHAIADRKARRGVGRPRIAAAGERLADLGGLERAWQRFAGPQRTAGRDLVGADKAKLPEQLLQSEGPFLIVAEREIV